MAEEATERLLLKRDARAGPPFSPPSYHLQQTSSSETWARDGWIARVSAGREQSCRAPRLHPSGLLGAAASCGEPSVVLLKYHHEGAAALAGEHGRVPARG